MKSLKPLIVLILALATSPTFLLGNAAQPGIWTAGGTGTFSLIFPEDSVAYKKIQMKNEQIFIKIHPGFALVKGVYNFYNHSDSILNIKIGYPKNSVFPAQSQQAKLNDVWMDDLYDIKGAWGDNRPSQPLDSTENWYIWDASFPGKTEVKFTVLFMVNTNSSSQIQGYNKSYKNGFIYLIETGSIWKSPIEKGDFYVSFHKDVDYGSITASAPSPFLMNLDQRVLKFKMEDYGKSPDPNLVITYGDRLDSFDFENALAKSAIYFQDLENFSNQPLDTITYKAVTFNNPYDVTGTGGVITWVIYIFLYGIPAFLIIGLGYFIYKRFLAK